MGQQVTITVTLTDDTTIRLRDTDRIHAVLQHLTCGGQDRVGFTLTDDGSGRDVEFVVADIQRIEVAR